MATAAAAFAWSLISAAGVPSSTGTVSEGDEDGEMLAELREASSNVSVDGLDAVVEFVAGKAAEAAGDCEAEKEPPSVAWYSPGIDDTGCVAVEGV
jgi:hypothetical protein